MAEDRSIGVDDRPLDDAALEALAAAHATPPPTALRERLLDEARRDLALETVMHSRRRWRLVGVIAAVLTLALAGLLARSIGLDARRDADYAALDRTNRDLLARLEEQQRTLAGLRSSLAVQAQVLRVLGGPRTITAVLAPSEGNAGHGRVIVDATSGEGAIVLAGLAPAGAGKVYELWAIRGDRPPEPAGIFEVGNQGAIATVTDRIARPAELTTFAVSIEPSGGSRSPTGPIVLVGGLAAG